MGYEELWKALADLYSDLREKGELAPNEIMKDLRSAKTMIQILKADPTNPENLLRVEKYLEKVESRLLIIAEDKIGEKRAKQWMRTFEGARKGIGKEERKNVISFVPGIPRGKSWIRVKVSKDLSSEDVKKLIDKNRLSFRMQEDGYILVYGNDEKIKTFVQKIRKKRQNNNEKYRLKGR